VRLMSCVQKSANEFWAAPDVSACLRSERRISKDRKMERREEYDTLRKGWNDSILLGKISQSIGDGHKVVNTYKERSPRPFLPQKLQVQSSPLPPPGIDVNITTPPPSTSDDQKIASHEALSLLPRNRTGNLGSSSRSASQDFSLSFRNCCFSAFFASLVVGPFQGEIVSARAIETWSTGRLTYLLRVCLSRRATCLRLVGFRHLVVGLRHLRSMKGFCIGGRR